MTLKHMGNLVVTKENAPTFPPITEFYGHLTIQSGAHLVAPNLQLVRGWLTIEPGARLDALRLGEIKGWLSVGEDAHVDAPNLHAVERDVVIASTTFYAGLLSVGSLRVTGNVQMDDLLSISGSLTVTAGAVAKLVNLTHIGGSITLKPSAHLLASSLKHIGGYYDADESAVLVAPAFLAS